MTAPVYWLLLVTAVAVWATVARHYLHLHRWEKRKLAQLADRKARVAEDLAWIYDRDDALNACAHITVRRAQDHSLRIVKEVN